MISIICHATLPRPAWLPEMYWFTAITPRRKCFTCDRDADREARWPYVDAHLWCDSTGCDEKAKNAIGN